VYFQLWRCRQITVILSGETPKILFEAADAISALETHWLRDHGKPELVFADNRMLIWRQLVRHRCEALPSA
jgi:hypothetical protein